LLLSWMLITLIVIYKLCVILMLCRPRECVCIACVCVCLSLCGVRVCICVLCGEVYNYEIFPMHLHFYIQKSLSLKAAANISSTVSTNHPSIMWSSFILNNLPVQKNLSSNSRLPIYRGIGHKYSCPCYNYC